MSAALNLSGDTQLAALDFSKEFHRWGKEFIGREKLFDLVDTALQTGRKQLTILTGGPGTGKSAFAAQLTRRRTDIAAFHFCIDGRIATVTSGTILRSLAAQLIQRIPGYPEALVKTLKVNRSVSVNINVGQMEANGSVIGVALGSLATSSADEDLEILLRAPLSELANPPQRAILVIDGLDEAVRHGGASNLVTLLGQIGDLPPWVRLLYTTQPTDAVMRYLEFLQPRVISLEESASADDVPLYAAARMAREPLAGRLTAASMTAGDLIPEVARRAENNFLFAKLLLDDIESGAQSIGHFDDLPSTLDETYRRYLVRACGTEWEAVHQPVLGKLAVAQEALSETEIARFSGLTRGVVRRSLTVVDRFLTALHRVNPNERPAAPFYRLYHNSFKTFLVDSERARSFWCDPVEENSRIAASYSASGMPQWDDYGVRHMPWHLSQANAAGSLRSVLLSYPWLEAKLRKASVQDVLADLQLTEGDTEVRTVASLLRISAGSLAVDPGQLWSHVYMRTMTGKNPLTNFPARPPGSWVKPLTPAMRQANDALVWTLQGHARSVRTMAMQRGTGVLVTGDVDGVVRFWDIVKGIQVSPPFVCKRHTDSIQLSPRGDEVAGVSPKGEVKIWNLATGEPVNTFQHTGAFEIHFSEDRPWLTTRSTQGGTRIWDRQAGASRPLGEHGFDLCFIPGTDLAATRDTWALEVFEVATAKVLHQVKLGGSVDGDPVAVSRDGRYVASSGGDHIKVLDLASGACNEIEVVNRVATIATLAFNADASRIAGGSRGNRYQRGYQVEVWDVAERRSLAVFQGHRGTVSAVAFSEDGRYVISAGYDRKLQVWDIQSPQNEARGHQNRVTGAVVTQSGTCAITGSDDGDLLEWKVSTRTVEREIPFQIGVEHLAVSRGGDLAVLGFLSYVGQWGSEFESRVQVFRPGKTEPVKLIDYSGGLRKQRYEAAQFTDDGRSLILARQLDESDTFKSARIEVWDWTKKKLLRQIEYTEDRLSRMLLLPGSLKLLAAEEKLNLWDLAAEQPRPVEFGIPGYARALALRQDGRVLAVGRVNGAVELWNVESITLLQSTHCHEGAVDTMAFFANGDLASIGSDDGFLKVWRRGKLRAACLGDDPFTALAITPEGIIVAGDAHGRVHFLEVQD